MSDKKISAKHFDFILTMFTSQTGIRFIITGRPYKNIRQTFAKGWAMSLQGGEFVFYIFNVVNLLTFYWCINSEL